MKKRNTEREEVEQALAEMIQKTLELEDKLNRVLDKRNRGDVTKE